MSSTSTTHDRDWGFLDDRDTRGTEQAGSRPARARRTEEPPPFWRAPFSAHYYREVGYVLTGLPVAIAGFTVAVVLFSFGAGTFVTVLGLPVLAGLTVVARGFGRLERSRARGMLGLDVSGPEPVRRSRPGTWGAITARLADAAGWKGVLHQVVMFPWAVFSFAMTLVFLLVGWTMALYPLYHWVFPTFTSWRGYRLFDYTDGKGVEHVYFVEGAGQIAAVSVAGIVIVFLTAQLVRGLTNVNRAAIQGLCGR
ncbi:sensor domain-containing protein [Streptomyces sp. SP17BM10]|uniref:sensor domain-containing protein n=1 Tax=Streptomyces sp. SP17BM10 TaxID=3002530 RepID=UPI002E76F55F|nr:sensor domain-containing protein [Streptomyces sp. SP17BM10]MEE1784196.1 sensor domain-containing protein [Streptomyces sp. SP17BM10]